MREIIVIVTVTFINLITGKKGETLCFYTALPAPQIINPEGFISVQVGDGRETIWGSGNCIYRLKIKDFSQAEGVTRVILEDTEFSESFKKEFKKNWKLLEPE